MNRDKLIGGRFELVEHDLRGTILDVHLDLKIPTAKFLPDDWDEDKATWVNIDSLRPIDPSREK